MSGKCFFCEYDYGPVVGPSPKCCACFSHKLFEPKKHMSGHMAVMYEKFKSLEEGVDGGVENYDRATALAVLKALSKHLYPSHDLFGNATLVIDRYKFELVRKRFLDDTKGERE